MTFQGAICALRIFDVLLAGSMETTHPIKTLKFYGLGSKIEDRRLHGCLFRDLRTRLAWLDGFEDLGEDLCAIFDLRSSNPDHKNIKVW